MNDIQFKITVLITFYNQEKYVDEALRSVFMQKTNFLFKVIIGDDGSTDQTLDKIKAWQLKYPDRIMYIVHDRVPGKKYIGGSRASKNRLVLLDLVDTPYFIFLDGDDYWTDNRKLQIQFDELENDRNSDCIACAHQINMFKEKNPLNKICIPDDWFNKKYGKRKWNIKEYWKSFYFHTDAILFRSNVVKFIDKYLLENFFNDNIITFCFIRFGKIIYLPLNMVNYRQNDNGIWAGDKKEVGIIREFMSYDIECKLFPDLISIINNRHIYDFILFKQNHNIFDGISPDYLALSRKYDLNVTKRILEHKHLFTNLWIIDNFIIFFMRIKRKIYSMLIKILGK